MDTTPERLLSSIADQLQTARKIVVAFSGGLDSSVLLHAVTSVFPAGDVVAVHVNHGLSPNSDHWQQHCADVCDSLGVECIARQVKIASTGEGLEQAARRARYHIFESSLETGDVLLMAHHLDDQVETVLYRLLRGAGPTGLAAIPAARQLGKGMLVRPFLLYPRSTLERYGGENQLTWIDDESNRRRDFDRNYLRHEVVPQLAKRWPDYRQRIARAGEQCGSAAEELKELAQQDLELTDERKESTGFSIAIDRFAILSTPRKKNLLKEWISLRELGPVGHTAYDEVLQTLIPARIDGNPQVRWPLGQFRRFRNRLYLLPRQDNTGLATVEISVQLTPNLDAIALPDGTRLECELGMGKQALAIKAGDKLTVAFRKGGEYCHPVDRPGGASLKKLLNEYGVEPWLRDRLPLIYLNGELASVAGLFVCRGFHCGDAGPGVVFKWKFPDR